MATVNIVGGVADGYVRKHGSVSWAATIAAGPTYARDNVTSSDLWKALSGGGWYLYRIYYCFDVSAFQAGGAHAGATINSVTLNYYINSHNTYAAFTVFWKDWGTSLTTADWSATLGTAASASTLLSSTGAKTLALTNLSSLLTSNGRLEIAYDDETTDPGVTSYQLGWNMADAASNKPSIDVDYTDAATGSFFFPDFSGGLNYDMTGGI
jgi:hypothetical protein